jgi:hypothetical protein
LSRPPLADLRPRVLGSIDLTPCDGCDACALRCESGVPMSRDEYRDVLRYMEAATNCSRIGVLIAQDKTVDLGDGVTVTLCRFLNMDTRRCAVYPVRPLVCRLLGHVPWMPCPIGKVERVAPEGASVALMQAYADVERRSFEEWAALEPEGRSDR